jgi:hypothetical protein|tara:strand:+ start:3385 stop:3981 length:597 start_codon:yes stop_codon:yes gene_type:complete
MAEEYNQAGIDALANSSRPIPGQSLTDSPDQSYPWESPPEYTNFQKAFNYLAEELLEEDIYVSLIVAMGQGVPISDITLQLLQRGFQEGKWNPDLLLMLIEPTMYLLMALAEKAEIEPRLYGDEEEDLDDEEQNERLQLQSKNLSELAKDKVGDMPKVPSGVLPAEIVEEIEALEVPESLLARPEPQEQPESLLGRPE